MQGDEDRQSALDWMERFAACVRARDIASARPMFSAGLRSFGTRTVEASSLDELVAQQWQPTWLRTREFRYQPGSVELRPSADGSMMLAVARWESIGVDSPEAWDRQAPYARRGRCSFVLQREDAGAWVCIHTHFSMDPDPVRPA